MLNAYKQFWKNYIDFTSHTNRKDFWLASLLNTIIYLIPAIPSFILFYSIYYSGNVPNELPMSGIVALILGGIAALYGLAALIPAYAITVRRLRDGGFQWWFIFLGLVPYVGGLALFILMLLPTNFYPLKKEQ